LIIAEPESVPVGADLNLGCGNPVALASLIEGETVVDLDSGGGLDCFLAANKVGSKGRVIGVDLTPEMLEKARTNCRRSGYANVEFRLGEIENFSNKTSRELEELIFCLSWQNFPPVFF
jgi:arsenite methyltransferase